MKLCRFGCVVLALCLGSSAQAQATPQPVTGGKLYGQQCGACHSLVPGEVRVGPSLAGIVGRRAGSVAAFDYSAALKASALTWDAASLDRWLTDSRAAVPGTKMPFRLADPAKRQLIIAFLKNGGK